MQKSRSYTTEEKEQILNEVSETGNVAAVARKNDIPVGTIHNWLGKNKKGAKKNRKVNANLRAIKSQRDDLKLENKILKELLKKTYQIWDTN